MDKLVAKALWLAKKADPRKLSLRQWIKTGGAVAAVYLIVLGVNVLVLTSQIGSNEAKTQGIRGTIDAMSLNFDLGSRILDADLKENKAIGRVGAYYLTDERFMALAKTEAQFQRSRNKGFTQANARFFADSILDRMLIEQLVGQYAKDNKLEADQKIVEIRIAQNMRKLGSLKKLEQELQKTYGWSLSDFRYEVEFSVLRAKMEDALGGQKYADAAKKGFQNSPTTKVKDYADDYARSHNNYLLSGGQVTLANRLLSL